MFTYMIRRILIAVPVLFGITIINFMIVKLAPGNPVDMMINPSSSPENLEAMKLKMGLLDPIWMQYVKWLNQLFQGNLGYSIKTFEPVGQMIGDRMGPTLLLMGSALLIGLVIAIPIGICSALKQNTALDHLSTGVSFLGISIPPFFLGLAFIYIFALVLKILPTGGMSSLGGDGGAGDLIKHMTLPALVLAVAIAGRKVRYVRSSVLDILGQDYLRTARAKGLGEFVVTSKHAFRNALIPIITVVGLEVPNLLGGAAITEQIFQWPGIGQLTIQSIMSRDYPVIMGINFMIAIVVLASNLLTDLLYSAADPRIKYE
nr:ABC transporter permease [Paenibacillus phytorum]